MGKRSPVRPVLKGTVADDDVGTDASLSFDSLVTCAGDIYHRRKDGSPVSLGTVQIKDADGVYQEMLNPDDTWLDSDHPEWQVESQNRWDGHVASAAHQVNPLRLPLVTPEHPRELVERGQPSDTPGNGRH